ncbi:unnamed protein product [Mytilus edulis]|uniref:Uncharacterized protein n=1 Tax=Mytilus edulis TaxID=6550 RepID=A0A8S3T866_MYTED|nr:unnamed protein product [Mytilus edulis]
MKLFGSAEDKKLANMVAEWMKGKTYEASLKKSVRIEQPDKENDIKMPHNFGAINNPASFGYPLFKVQCLCHLLWLSWNTEKDKEDYIDYRGAISQPLTHVSAEGVINNNEEFDLCNLKFRNPTNFIAGSLHDHFNEWEKNCTDKKVLDWVKNGVNVNQFLSISRETLKGGIMAMIFLRVFY